MIVRLTARFFDTESAQAAAQRISTCGADIYELRLYYGAEQEEKTVREEFTANNILYSAQNSISPYNAKSSVSRDLPIENAADEELRSECLMRVTTNEDASGQIRSIIYNEGGFDVFITGI